MWTAGRCRSRLSKLLYQRMIQKTFAETMRFGGEHKAAARKGTIRDLGAAAEDPKLSPLISRISPGDAIFAFFDGLTIISLISSA